MGTSNTERYKINGLVDTNQPVLDNLTNIANSCGTWITYSNELGKWGVVINRAETAVFDFNDSNIISTIEVTGVGLGDLYNNVRVSFPREDLRGETDWVNVEIPVLDRHPNEIDNTLELSYDLVTDPVQAELLGFIELKQSRLNRTIKFSTDWSSLGIVAGDVITVTNASYGFDQTLFRIISVTETTDDSGAITLDILAMGYSDSVYDEDLTLYERTNEDGIVTIGSIGQPVAPQLTKFERDADPRILIEAVVPVGIVEKMEFWFSTDGDNYNIVGTVAPTNADVFSTGDEVEYTYPTNYSGNVYFKVRAINSTAVSALSGAGTLLYAPVQTTEAIGADTDVVDGGGNSLLGLLGANALMALLKGLMEDDTTNTGSIWDKVFGLFEDETGTDIRSEDTLQKMLSNTVKHYQFDYIGGAGQTVGVSFGQSFTPTETGDYLVTAQFNWGAVTNDGIGLGWKFSQFNLEDTTTAISVTDWMYTGSYHPTNDPVSSLFDDHYMRQAVTLTAGTQYDLGMVYSTDWVLSNIEIFITVTIEKLPDNVWAGSTISLP